MQMKTFDTLKVCPGCKQSKPRSKTYFVPRTDKKYLFQSQCRMCLNKKRKAMKVKKLLSKGKTPQLCILCKSYILSVSPQRLEELHRIANER